MSKRERNNTHLDTRSLLSQQASLSLGERVAPIVEWEKMNPRYSERAEEFQEGFMQLSEHDNWIVPHNAIQPEKLVFCHSLFLISTTFYLMNSDCFPCTWHFKEKLKILQNMFICFAVLCEWEHLFSKLKTMCGFFFFCTNWKQRLTNRLFVTKKYS